MKETGGNAVAAVLETPRLRLRRISDDDADFILELLNEPSYIQNIGDRGLRTSDNARSYISNKLRASYDNFGYGLYLVESKEETIPLGISGFVKREVLEHADIGFAFLQRFWSKGYAYESAAGVLGYGRAVLGFDRVLGITAPHNKSSIRLLEKLGLRFERMIQLPGLTTEQKLFSTPEFKAPNQTIEHLMVDDRQQNDG